MKLIADTTKKEDIYQIISFDYLWIEKERRKVISVSEYSCVLHTASSVDILGFMAT